jgi:hypothetical protein
MNGTRCGVPERSLVVQVPAPVLETWAYRTAPWGRGVLAFLSGAGNAFFRFIQDQRHYPV